MAKSKIKYYVVWVGQNPGIYESWKECQAQISGFPNAKYKSFSSKSAAEEAFLSNAGEYISKKKATSKKKPCSRVGQAIIKNSISVDAACSRNPGIMEYRGVNTISGEEIFRMGPFDDGTNNIGEFLALVHALAMLKKQEREDVAIYTDSRTGLSWVKNKKVKTTLQKTDKNKILFELIERAVKWLKTNEFKTRIVKWDTKNWGEIPADFGRK
ncbi:MAG: ribonuclease H family protein [Bacteroidia bacterium]|nr:ribonuclease H family protein [Bacteroidia bacterium]